MFERLESKQDEKKMIEMKPNAMKGNPDVCVFFWWKAKCVFLLVLIFLFLF